MPTYDYKCTNCGHVVEAVHGVNQPGPTVCPECGGLLRKQMSAPAIHFRGTGWAKKDARQAVAARAGKTESGEPLKSGDAGKAGESGKSKDVASEGSAGSSAATGDKSGDKESGKSKAAPSAAASGKD